MKLITAEVHNFRCIENSGIIRIDPEITILVGQNESGKTAFLKSLDKSKSLGGSSFNIIEDYPRRHLTQYEQEHKKNPATVVTLEYSLDKNEVEEINSHFSFELLTELTFKVNHSYDNNTTVELNVPEEKFIKHMLTQYHFPEPIKEECSKFNSLNKIFEFLQNADKNQETINLFEKLKSEFSYGKAPWENLIEYKVWELLKNKIPSFLYFDDYFLLPGKKNITELNNRKNSNQLQSEDKTILGLLEMADISIDDLIQASGYENSKAKLEAISNSITDQVFEYWKQNKELDVEIDVRPDPKDVPPFNNGNNLYIRIKNRKHRVSVPFNQRSKGFIWFFSFMVWFDSIKKQINTTKDLILLLDEPGLSLHALAQNDFLDYIDFLSHDHQILYTTHSPFMVRSDKLHQVRVVEDKDKSGTKISDNLSLSDSSTIFPLQAALGYTIAQNLFISKYNLVVEGVSDLLFLKTISEYLKSSGKEFLNDEIIIVPAGGLDKVASFIALLKGNSLKFVVLHDFCKKPDQHLESLKNEKILVEKQVLNYAMFRQPESSVILNTDIEDLFSVQKYLELFNKAYSNKLDGQVISEEDLPTGDRIVERLKRLLMQRGIKLSSNGSFNHYSIANYLAIDPKAVQNLDKETISRFSNLFSKVNDIMKLKVNNF